MTEPGRRTLRSGRVFGGSSPDLRLLTDRASGPDGGFESLQPQRTSPVAEIIAEQGPRHRESLEEPPDVSLADRLSQLENSQKRFETYLADMRSSLFLEVREIIKECYDDIRDEFRQQRSLGPNRPSNVAENNLLSENSNTSNTSRAAIKPLPFDGSIAWEDYRNHFEVVAEANNWDTRMMGLALASSLSGAALPVLSELTVRDYKHLSELLSARFGDDNRAQLYMDRLKSRRQRPDEDIATFGQEIRTLARKSLPGASKECVEILAVSQFMENLYNDRVRELVMLAAPKTLETATSTALQSESAVLRARTANFRKPVHPTPVQPLRLIRESPAICWRCDSEGHTMRECPTRKLICWRCDQPGHGIRECPSRKSGNEKQSW
ncbi:ZnF_C2HC [Nesidiocoris tenuis]|uniref:ZnF_C2HC n=1 Tax=Nesidiocoris tenuis TaxID=355587 RepID=A0ABN7ABT6_9HEMI|nr:ZnF_C2HC [Nesidiocoris tenuis]